MGLSGGGRSGRRGPGWPARPGTGQGRPAAAAAAAPGITAVYIERLLARGVATTKPHVSIENVVASASVEQEIDLNAVLKKCPGTEYNPEQFPGLVFRLAEPKTSTLIFRTGKMVCTGAKSEEMAVDAVRAVVRHLRRRGVRIKKDAVIVIQNIVAAINLHGAIQIERAARILPRSMYEPEQFPGLIHRMVEPKAVVLLFASGKLVCTGTKKETDVFRSVHGLHATLEEKGLMVYK